MDRGPFILTTLYFKVSLTISTVRFIFCCAIRMTLEASKAVLSGNAVMFCSAETVLEEMGLTRIKFESAMSILTAWRQR